MQGNDLDPPTTVNVANMVALILGECERHVGLGCRHIKKLYLPRKVKSDSCHSMYTLKRIH